MVAMKREHLYREVLRAAERIAPYIRETPLDLCPAFARHGAETWVKCEHLQRTGSFKLRGALNRLLCLDEEKKRAGVVAASTGNHGAAVAHGLARLGIPGEVWVPETAAPTKVEAIRRLGAEIVAHGEDGVETEVAARRAAEAAGKTYLSPYNDQAVMAGQGTVGLEIFRQLPEVDSVFVAVGGGGLISGIAAALKEQRPGVRIVGCSPELSPVMHRSVEAGKLLTLDYVPTLSDGTAGGVEAEALTFPCCRDWVDDWLLVSEAEIAKAMLLFMETEHQMIEGSAAVPMAAYLRHAEAYAGRKVAFVSCGANLSLEVLRRLLNEGREA